MDRFWERYIQSRPAPGESKGAFEAFAAAHRDPGPRNMYAGGQLVRNTADGSRPGYQGKKERIIQGLEKKRVSTKVDLYRNALDEFSLNIQEAFDNKDASNLQKSWAQFLKDKGLKEGTYGHLVKTNALPKIKTDVAKLRLDLANKIIDTSNNQLKFIEMEQLLKNHGFTSGNYKSFYTTSGGNQLNKLDKAGDKARKAYDFLFSNFDQPVENFFNPRDKISKLTGLDVGTISRKFDIQKYDPKNYKLYKNLGNNIVQRKIKNRGLNLNQLDLDLERIKTQKDFQVTRKTKVDIGKKYASKDDLIDIGNFENKKKQLNKYFMEHPNAINNTEFGKEIKKQMDIRIAGKDMVWDGKKIKKGDIWFKTRPDKYYYDVAKSDKGIFHIFDINPIESGERFTRVPDNINMATRDFNSGFVKQLNEFFKKGGPLHGNTESLKKVTALLDDYNIRVQIKDIGRIGTHEQVAVNRIKGTYPRITKTLERFKLPDELKKISRKPGGVQLSSLGGVFDDFLKSGAAKKIGSGLRKVGAEFEAAFIVFDFMNNLGKGIEPGEALQKSLQTASLNFYKGGDRATIENILKEAKEAGFDPKVMDSLIKVNQSQLKITDFNKKINSNLKAIEDLKEKDASNPFIQRQIKVLENFNKRLESNLDKEIEIGGNLFNTYATNVKRSKGSFEFTEDDINKSFIELQTAAINKLSRERIKSAKTKSTQVDVETGPIGDVIQNAIGGLWTYPKFAYDVINPFSPLPKMDAWKTEGMKEKERIIDMQKRGGPGELYRYNIARGFDIDQPLTGQAYETMIEEQPYLGLEKGGIANLTRTVAPDSGPMSQGLRSLYINDKDY